ncbi:glycosyltransferase, partial [Streptomyces sp. NRRL WC-3774]
MRALHIITGLGVGGAEQQLRLLLRHLPVDCEVVTLTNPGAVADGLVADGVRVTHLGMAGNRDLAALPRLVRLIRRGHYDLVHTHLYRACVYGRLAARLAGVRAVVATEHSLGDSQMEGRRLTPGVRALYLASERLGRATVAVSPTVADRLRRWGVPAPRISVVPNGIDLARFRFDPAQRLRTRQRLGLPETAYVVGGIGRLTAAKRFDVLIHALAQLPDHYWLLLVGGGPEEHVLRRTAHAAGVADRVLFTGERPCVPDGSPGPDLPSLTAAMDLLASPCPEEAFGLAVVEALAAGLPVRYAACPAVEDLPPH